MARRSCFDRCMAEHCVRFDKKAVQGGVVVQAACECGWAGGSLWSQSMAAEEGRAHLAEHQVLTPLTVDPEEPPAAPRSPVTIDADDAESIARTLLAKTNPEVLAELAKLLAVLTHPTHWTH